jgi:phosphoenolpyruvate synthase/pyruvate phosphate dikinase
MSVTTVSRPLSLETRQRSPEVLWLGDQACHDPSLVGGKAASLSRLAVEHRVPPGFSLTTAAHQRWSHAAGPATSVIPNALRSSIAAAYRALGERCGMAEPRVAVRSSAADEDGLAASFAGQHETYLNVVGVEAVVEAVIRCWQSAYAERALEYRRQKGLSDDIKLAVLVQYLVAADSSMVVFSANPISRSRDEILINSSWGLGESIVGGTVTPDTYVVRKTDLSVTQRRIADKRRMTVMVPGGTREVDVPRFLRAQPTLGEAQVIEVAQLALALEQTMGWAVDVECAYEGERLHLLQCRPITTL